MINIPEQSRLMEKSAYLDQLVSYLQPEAGSQTKIAIISGLPGSGKSTLCEQALATLEIPKWIFSTKFDQNINAQPASFFIALLNNLANRIIALPSIKSTRLRKQLVDTISPDGQLFINLCPRMQEVLGAQPELIELPPQENQIRFSSLMRKLLNTIARNERQLYLFIDDWQWADPATQNLLLDLVLDIEQINITVLITSRVNTHNETLSGFRHAVKTAGLQLLDISLQGITQQEISQLLQKQFRLSDSDLHELSHQISRSTDSTPLAVLNLVNILQHLEIVSYSENNNAWSLDSQGLEHLLQSGDALHLMNMRLDLLSDSARKLLCSAACIGNHFDTDLLAKTADVAISLVEENIAEMLELQFIQQSSSYSPAQTGSHNRQCFRFTHDLIQQAAFNGIAKNDHQRFLLRAAQEHAKRFNNEFANEELFKAVILYNSLSDGELNASERQKAFALNIIAAKEALETAAPTMAFNFVAAAISQAEENVWHDQYDLAWSLYCTGAEAAYLCADHERLQELCATALQQARTDIDWAQAGSILLQERISNMAYPEALDIAIDSLKKLGLTLPRKPGKLTVLKEFIATRLLLNKHSIDDLYNLPKMYDARAEREMQTLMLASSAAYFAEPNLFPLIIMKMVRLSLNFGNSSQSAFGWVCYGLALCSVSGEVQKGYHYGILSLRLLEKFKTTDLRARIHMLFNVFVRHWQESRQLFAQHLLEGEKAGFKTGDLEFSSYCMWHRCNDAFWSGTALPEVERMLDQARVSSMQHKQEKVTFLLNTMQFFFDWIRTIGHADDSGKDTLHENYCHDQRDYTSLCYVKLYQALRLALCGEMYAAFHTTRTIDQHFEALQGQFYVPYYYLLQIITASELASSEHSLLLRRKYKKIIKKRTTILKKWAQMGSIDALQLYEVAEDFCILASYKPIDCLQSLEKRANDKTSPYFIRILAANAALRISINLNLHLNAQGLEELLEQHFKKWCGYRLTQQKNQNAVNKPFAEITKQPEADKFSEYQTHMTLDEIAETYLAKISRFSEIKSLQIVLLENKQYHMIFQAKRQKKQIWNLDFAEQLADELTESYCEQAISHYDIGHIISEQAPEQLHRISLKVRQHDQIDVCLNMFFSDYNGLSIPAASLLELISPFVTLLRQERYKQLFKREIDRRIALTTAHARLMPAYFLKAFGHQEITDLHVGDFVNKHMSVMFCDIRGSTGIIEEIGARAGMMLLNEIFIAIENEVLNYNGYVDNFYGDAMLNLFDNQPDTAIQCGIAISQQLHRICGKVRKSGLHAAGFGIGISTGDIVLGSVGGLNQIRGTCVGDPVNLAARIENLTRRYDANMLISEDTYQKCRDLSAFNIRLVDYITVAGRKKPVRIFEILDAASEEIIAQKKAILELFQEGVKQFYNGDFKLSEKSFSDCLQQSPNDQTSIKFLARSRKYAKEGAPEGWLGIHHINLK